MCNKKLKTSIFTNNITFRFFKNKLQVRLLDYLQIRQKKKEKKKKKPKSKMIFDFSQTLFRTSDLRLESKLQR